MNLAALAALARKFAPYLARFFARHWRKFAVLALCAYCAAWGWRLREEKCAGEIASIYAEQDRRIREYEREVFEQLERANERAQEIGAELVAAQLQAESSNYENRKSIQAAELTRVVKVPGDCGDRVVIAWDDFRRLYDATGRGSASSAETGGSE